MSIELIVLFFLLFNYLLYKITKISKLKKCACPEAGQLGRWFSTLQCEIPWARWPFAIYSHTGILQFYYKVANHGCCRSFTTIDASTTMERSLSKVKEQITLYNISYLPVKP